MLPLSSGGVKDSQVMNSPKAIASHRHVCLYVKVNLCLFLMLLERLRFTFTQNGNVNLYHVTKFFP